MQRPDIRRLIFFPFPLALLELEKSLQTLRRVVGEMGVGQEDGNVLVPLVERLV